MILQPRAKSRRDDRM